MIEIMASGFLFLFIIITNIASGKFGYETFSDLDSKTKLRSIYNDPKKFKISFSLILIEHFSIIFLALMLFLAFNQTNIVLALIWTVFRTVEGLIQIYGKKNYWKLIRISEQFQNTEGNVKNSLIESGHKILKKKNSIFTFAQILFSIGTLAYSIMFVTYVEVPMIIGWLGIVSSIIYYFGSVIVLLKPNSKILWGIGGLLILIFELILGGWLLFSSII